MRPDGTWLDADVLRVRRTASTTATLDSGGSQATVVDADWAACNGVAHGIDAVLLPPAGGAPRREVCAAAGAQLRFAVRLEPSDVVVRPASGPSIGGFYRGH